MNLTLNSTFYGSPAALERIPFDGLTGRRLHEQSGSQIGLSA
jgi:hypothetical protein